MLEHDHQVYSFLGAICCVVCARVGLVSSRGMFSLSLVILSNQKKRF